MNFADRKKIWAAALLGVFFCLQTVQVFRGIPSGQTLFELPYQFGPYSWSLLRLGTYADCSQPPCKYANRMPVLPLTLDLLGRVSLRSRTAALLKNGLLLLLTGAALFWLMDVHARLFPGRGGAWLVLAPLAVAMPIVRHASAIEYEEGILTELTLLWALCFLLGAWTWLKRERGEGGRLVVSGLVLATVMYLTKDSLLLVWLCSAALAAFWSVRFRDAKTAVVTACCCAALLGWGLHNAEASGRFSIASSWDGENTYRGFNTESFEIYPYISLDETVSPPHLLPLPGVGYVALGARWPKFKDEWAWNDYFRREAEDWVEAHPAMALEFQAEKFAHFFFSLREYIDAGGTGRPQKLWETASMAAGRLGELELAVLLVLLWRLKEPAGRALALAVLAANAAYAAPYVICFNYERHIAVYFTIVAASLLAVLSALPRGGPGPGTGAP